MNQRLPRRQFLTPIKGLRALEPELSGLRPGQPLELRAEPENPHDPNAIQVWAGEELLGYIPRMLAARLCQELAEWRAYVGRVLAHPETGELAGLRALLAPAEQEIDAGVLRAFDRLVPHPPRSDWLQDDPY